MDDAEHPTCIAGCVAQEVNHGNDGDSAFYVATPPLEAKRLLCSRWARERKRNGQHLKLHCLDVRKANFNVLPLRNMFVILPTELRLGKGKVGRLKHCMYGTRDAGAL